MKEYRTARRMILVAALLGFAVTAASAQEDIRSGPKPAWVAVKPRDDNTFMYFVGLGSSANGDLTEALEFARLDLDTQIGGFVGSRITAQSTTGAAGNLDELQASISKWVKVSFSAQLAGMRPEEKWYEKSARGVNVYVLRAYEQAALLKEKKRIEELFQAQIDAVRIPETEGGKLALAGRLYEAAIRFIEAAVAAAESSLEDKDVALNRTLAEAMAAVEKINLIKLNDNLSGVTGAEPEEAFKLKAAAGAADGAKGVPQTAILVTYFAGAGGSELSAKTARFQTDAGGLLAFRHPALTFVGKGKIVMQIDLFAYLEKLKRAEKKSPEKVAALTGLILSKKQEFLLTALAPAKNLSLAVFVVDMDENGKPLKNNQSTASGINESLSKQGFKLKSAGLDPALAAGTGESELGEMIRRKVPGAERAIVGTAAVESAEENQGRYIITVSGTVKVLELKSKKTLYEKSFQKKYVGANLETGRSAAFKQLGKELGVWIAAEAE